MSPRRSIPGCVPGGGSPWPPDSSRVPGSASATACSSWPHPSPAVRCTGASGPAGRRSVGRDRKPCRLSPPVLRRLARAHSPTARADPRGLVPAHAGVLPAPTRLALPRPGRPDRRCGPSDGTGPGPGGLPGHRGRRGAGRLSSDRRRAPRAGAHRVRPAAPGQDPTGGEGRSPARDGDGGTTLALGRTTERRAPTSSAGPHRSETGFDQLSSGFCSPVDRRWEGQPTDGLRAEHPRIGTTTGTSEVDPVSTPGAERRHPPEATVRASATRRRMMEPTAEVGTP
jgi:hypothetical protein